MNLLYFKRVPIQFSYKPILNSPLTYICNCCRLSHFYSVYVNSVRLSIKFNNNISFSDQFLQPYVLQLVQVRLCFVVTLKIKLFLQNLSTCKLFLKTFVT